MASADSVKDGKVSANVFADMVGVTVRDVQLLCKSSSIASQKVSGVWYIPFPKGLQDYIQIYKDRAAGRGGADRDELERKKILHDAELKEAKAKLAKLELNEKTGRLHNSDIVEEVLNEFVYYVRSSLLALPGRISNDLIIKLKDYFTETKLTAAVLSSTLADEINFILTDFASYKYSADVMEQKRKEHETGLTEIEDDESD